MVVSQAMAAVATRILAEVAAAGVVTTGAGVPQVLRAPAVPPAAGEAPPASELLLSAIVEALRAERCPLAPPAAAGGAGGGTQAALVTQLLELVDDAVGPDAPAAPTGAAAVATAAGAAPPGLEPLDALVLPALATHVLSGIAAAIDAHPVEAIVAVAVHTAALRRLFTAMPVLATYFLSLLPTDNARRFVLSDAARLEALGLSAFWHVPARGDGAVLLSEPVVIADRLSRPPCVLEASDALPLSREYADVAARLKAADTTAASLSAWIIAQPPDNRYRLRMLLLLAAYYEFFVAGRSCAVLAGAVHSEPVRVALDLQPGERRVFEVIAGGPTRGASSSDKGLQHLFSAAAGGFDVGAGAGAGAAAAPAAGSEQDRVWQARHRNAALNAMACMLGVPRGRCYYHMACFHHDRMSGDRSHGLGSDNGTLAKDCGYYFTQGAGEVSFRAGGPFRDVRRHRALNNYLIWVMVSWGQWLNGTATYSWMTTDPAQVDPRNRLSAEDRLHVTTLSRAHQFLEFLETDPTLVAAEIDPYTFAAVGTFAVQQRFAADGACRDHYPMHASSATMREAETYLATHCWEPLMAAIPTMKPAYLRDVVANAKLSALTSGMRAARACEAALAAPTLSQLQEAITAAKPAAPAARRADDARADADDVPLTVEQASALLLSRVMNGHVELATLVHIPVLVHFYYWLQTTFAHRYTLDEVLSLSVRQAINELRDTTLRAQGQALFTEFLASWRVLQETFVTVTPDCTSSPIAVLTAETAMLYQLLPSEDSHMKDAISQLLQDRVLEVQNSLLDSREVERLRAVPDAGAAASLNTEEALLPAKLAAMQLHELPLWRSAAAREVFVQVPPLAALTAMVASYASAGALPAGAGAAAAPALSLDLVACARYLLRAVLPAARRLAFPTPKFSGYLQASTGAGHAGASSGAQPHAAAPAGIADEQRLSIASRLRSLCAGLRHRLRLPPPSAAAPPP